ncbi:MAG: peptidylprolyl isomerase [Pseudomonadota bacterium]
MTLSLRRWAPLLGLLSTASLHAADAEDEPLTPASVIAASTPDDWRQPAQEHLVYLKLAAGEVVFERAPDFAPRHVANLQTLIRQRYFDGLAVVRSQDNYVAQWGDPLAGSDESKPLGDAQASLDGEFFRPRAGIDLTLIDSRDPYADEVGFSRGFTVGSDGKRAWLTHCYGALGAGRGMEQDSGNGAELYVVTGHAPRHLDRNVTLLGRALDGIDVLSSLPRGTGALGFFETPEETLPIVSLRLGSDLPPAERKRFEVMRTDTETFRRYVEARTFRKHPWFLDEAGRIGLCNVGVPVRPAP